jgi:rubrerythrin
MELLVEGNNVSVKGEFVEVELEVKHEDDLLAGLDGAFEGFLEEEKAGTPVASAGAGTAPAPKKVPAKTEKAVREASESERIMEEALIPEKSGEEIAEEDDMMACPDCGALLHEHDTKCPSCGAEFEEGEEELGFECPKCNNLVGANDVNCPSCGEIFEGDGEAAPEPEAQPTTEVDEGRVAEILGDLEPFTGKGFDIAWLEELVRRDQAAGSKEVLVFVSRAKEIMALELAVAKSKDKKHKKMLKRLKSSACSPEREKRAGVEWGILELRSALRSHKKV